MMTTDDDKILIVGGVKKYGYNDYYEKGHGSILELSDLTGGWKEVNIPRVNKLRERHLSLMIAEADKNIFCGEHHHHYHHPIKNSNCNHSPFFINVLDNKNIAELQFLNMVATAKNLVQPELIGTFLHHAILDAFMDAIFWNCY